MSIIIFYATMHCVRVSGDPTSRSTLNLMSVIICMQLFSIEIIWFWEIFNSIISFKYAYFDRRYFKAFSKMHRIIHFISRLFIASFFEVSRNIPTKKNLYQKKIKYNNVCACDRIKYHSHLYRDWLWVEKINACVPSWNQVFENATQRTQASLENLI